MSMISAQIDELRRMADGQVTYRDAREVMLEAADTILELRDDLQQANAENSKLRNGYGSMSREHSQTIVELSDAYYSIDQLKAENAKLRQQLADVTESMGRVEERCAKLRELARDMWRFEQMSCSKCVAKNDGYCGIGIDEECPLEHSIYDRMCELGVEVDG